MRRAALIALALLCGTPAAVRAEIAVLSNGLTLKLAGHRTEQTALVLTLKGGGEIELPASAVRGFVPDEVLDELSLAPGEELRALAVAAAERAGVDPELVLAVVAAESGFRPRAVSRKGAQGLMQLMPNTASALGVEDSFDPVQNLDGGTRYLSALLALYDGDVRRALAAYNAGEAAVARHGGVPPYPETRAYLKRVLERYEGRQAVEKRPSGNRKGRSEPAESTKPASEARAAGVARDGARPERTE